MTQLRGLSRGVSAGVPAAWPRPAALGRLALTRGTSLWWALGLLATLLVTLPAWLPWLDPRLDFRALDDAKNHMIRIYHLRWLIERGVWYPRWLPDMFMGYGYPVLNFYAPVFYYLAWGLGQVLHLSIWGPFRATGVVAAVVSAAGVYALTGGALAPHGACGAGGGRRAALRAVRGADQHPQARRSPGGAGAGPRPVAPAGPVAPVAGPDRGGGRGLDTVGCTLWWDRPSS